MKKNLLSIAMLMALSSGAMAHEIGDKVYSNAAKWKITGKNLVVNGDFSDLQLAGWNSTDATIDKLTTFSVIANAGAKGANEIKVNEGQTALTNGIYQVVEVEQGGTYIVSMKVMNTSAAGFTDFDLTGGNVNYINAYYNTDGALATKDGTNLLYGTDGVCGGYTFSYKTDGFTEVNFPVKAPAEGKIIIDLRGLSADLEICDVTCQAADQIYDTRTPEKRIAYIESVLNSYDFSDKEAYADIVDEIGTIKGMIEAGEDEGYESEMENLEGYWEQFTAEAFSNVLNSINTGGSGSYSANWDNWTNKFNKMPDADGEANQFNAVSGWSWSTNRWAHKTAAANTPLQVTWMRGASGNWDNIATNTTTLDKGTYYFGVQGAGGMMTLDKNRWARSQAFQCAETQLFFNNDTTEMFLLPTADEYAAIDGNVIYKFEVAEDNTQLTFGIRCNLGQGLEETNGFDVCFWHPVLYKVLKADELTPEQKTYLDNVQLQIDALKGRIEVAEGYAAADQKAQPWGKEDLKKGIEEAKKRLAVWETIDQAGRLETMDNQSAEYNAEQAPYYVDGAYVQKDTIYAQANDEKALQNLIMNAGVRYINNEFINVFTSKNAPLSAIVKSIDDAESVLNSALYVLGDKAPFKAVIDEVKASSEKIAAETSDATMDADLAALAEATEKLAEATEVFKKSAEIQPITTFDFENGYEKEVTTDADGAETTTFVIKSVEGNAKMEFAEGQFQDEAADVYTYANGFQIAKSKSEAVNDGNILLIGNTANLLEINADAVPTENDVLRLDFTVYYAAWGNSIGNPEFLILDEAKDTIGGFRRGTWNAMDYTTFGIDGSKFYSTYHTKVGGGKDELKDCFALKGGSRVDYQLIFDFKAKTMAANATQYFGGTGNCEVDAFTSGEPVAFGNVQNPAKYISISGAAPKMLSGRRCSIDNLKIYKYASTATGTGISEVTSSDAAAAKAIKKVENGQIVIVKGGKTYNVAGAQIK